MGEVRFDGGCGVRVSLVMGSESDWGVMSHASSILERFLGEDYEVGIVSAHRTPERLFEYGRGLRGRGVKVVIAGAGGSAHLPGMIASLTTVPVLGVPVEGKSLLGLDSLFSIVQMPGGVPVGTFAVGKAGAVNAALFAVSIIGGEDEDVGRKLESYRAEQTEKVALKPSGFAGV